MKAFSQTDSRQDQLEFLKDLALPAGIFFLTLFMMIVVGITCLELFNKHDGGRKISWDDANSRSKIVWCGDFGQVTLPVFVVNIAGTQGNKYLRVKVVMEYERGWMGSVFEPYSPHNSKGRAQRIQATVLDVFSNVPLDVVLSPSKRSELTEKVKKAINSEFFAKTQGKVPEVYFPTFLIQ